MKVFNLYSVSLFVIFLSGCKKDFLSFPYTDGNIKKEDVFSSDRLARGFLNNAYNGLSDRYSLYDGQMLASGCDEAVSSDIGSANPTTSSFSVNAFNNGSWSPLRTFDAQHATMYDFLRRVNIFLENSSNSAIYPQTAIPPLRGEAFFLRAYYHFQLFERYGRIVLATRSFSPVEDLNIPRNTIDEVVSRISADCDSAVQLMRDSSIADQTIDKGRATKTAALALKSRLWLYTASPLHNANNDKTKWEKAAEAARELINYKKHSLLSFTDINNIWNFLSKPYNAEVIFATAAQSTFDIEKNNAPISYDAARGRNNPTQDLVDAFEMSNGKAIGEAGSGYNDQNPYINRDPRLAAFIMYNHTVAAPSRFKNQNVETFAEGKDNKASNPNSTVTGYYLRKFLSESAAWPSVAANQVRIPRTWVIFRYAEILLNAAEAINEASGPTAEALVYVNQVRARSNMPPLPLSLSQDALREKIQNERRVELCFEDHRFFDVRRWKKGDLFNKPARGVKIVKNANSTFTYQYEEVDTRMFAEKNYLFPIPQAELNLHPKLGQNPGW